MPNRVVRESLLDSIRYLAVDEGARLLYHQLLLLADDFGTLSIEYAFIGRRCFPNRPSDDRLDVLVGQLVDADLIRLYKFRDQRFAFIPRFRQRLKRETLKNPQPPDELLVDDLEAQEKFRKLNGHTFRGAALGQTVGGPPAAGWPPEGGRPPEKEEKRREVKGSEEKGIEEKAAHASDNRNAPQLMAELAEKIRLKNN
jgi:hypothetical protein